MTDSGSRSLVASILMMVTCLVLGLLAGGMLVIGVAFVSFWKSLSPSDFQAWFASYSHLIGRLMVPLGAGSVVATVATLGVCWSGPPRRRRRPPDRRSLSAYGVSLDDRCDDHVPDLLRGDERGVRAGRPFRCNGPRLARPMGILALDSYGTRDPRLPRGFASASAVMTLDARFAGASTT